MRKTRSFFQWAHASTKKMEKGDSKRELAAPSLISEHFFFLKLTEK